MKMMNRFINIYYTTKFIFVIAVSVIIKADKNNFTFLNKQKKQAENLYKQIEQNIIDGRQS